MIGSLSTELLQQIWWILVSIVGSLFLALNFVQGGQTLLWQVARTDGREEPRHQLARAQMGTDVHHAGALRRCPVRRLSQVLFDELRRRLLGLDSHPLHLRRAGGQLRISQEARQPAGREDLRGTAVPQRLGRHPADRRRGGHLLHRLELHAQRFQPGDLDASAARPRGGILDLQCGARAVPGLQRALAGCDVPGQQPRLPGDGGVRATAAQGVAS